MDRNRKTAAIEELSSIEKKIDAGSATHSDTVNRLKLLHELEDIDKFASMDLIQKVRVKWDIEGDENSKFFHGLINKKRRNQMINGIMVEKYWDIIQKDMFDFINSFFVSSEMPHGANSSFFTLIPKVSNPTLITDFRPISLIGTHYKIISKTLANRLAKVIDKIVSKEQSAFIVGRQILDGPIILSEIIEWHKKRNKQLLIFKVDFEKAFDSISWKYLDHILDSFGFRYTWRSWIKSCLSSSRASILVNGSPVWISIPCLSVTPLYDRETEGIAGGAWFSSGTNWTDSGSVISLRRKFALRGISRNNDDLRCTDSWMEHVGDEDGYDFERSKKAGSVVRKMAFLCGPEGNKFWFSNENKLVEVWWPSSVKSIIKKSNNKSVTAESAKDRQLLPPFLRAHAYTFALAVKLLLGVRDGTELEKRAVPFVDAAGGIIAVPINILGTRFNRGVKAINKIREVINGIIAQRRIDLADGTATPTQDLLFYMIVELDKRSPPTTDGDMSSDLLGLLICNS
ncbi:RNA-directed DNA polymerase, eukaryota, reverse transcriptase zinc-binding domain protein [Tanacetum coccineum]